MPKVVKLYEKSKGSLKHNQGPVGPKLPPIPRSNGVSTCKARCNAAFQKDNDAVKLAECLAKCNAKLVRDLG